LDLKSEGRLDRAGEKITHLLLILSLRSSGFRADAELEDGGVAIAPLVPFLFACRVWWAKGAFFFLAVGGQKRRDRIISAYPWRKKNRKVLMKDEELLPPNTTCIHFFQYTIRLFFLPFMALSSQIISKLPQATR